jgi:hexosaminidase
LDFTLSGSTGAAGVVHSTVTPKTVSIGAAPMQTSRPLREQAHRMELAFDRVTITGDTGTGRFYGVQTLVQLLKPANGKLRLPEGQIEDWPDLELRIIYRDAQSARPI